MNKELREDLKHLIVCNDKSITQDLRDDIKMTLDYIDNLENEILEYKGIEGQLLASIDKKHKIIGKAIDYICVHSLNVNGEIEDVLEIEECKDLFNILMGEDNE